MDVCLLNSCDLIKKTGIQKTPEEYKTEIEDVF